MNQILSDPFMALVWITKAVGYSAAFARIISLGWPAHYRIFAGYLVLCVSTDAVLFRLYGNWGPYIVAFVFLQWVATAMLVGVCLEAYGAIARGIRGFQGVRPWLLNIALGGSTLVAIGSLALEINHRGWAKVFPDTLLLSRFIDSAMALFLLVVILFLRFFHQKPTRNLSIHLHVLLTYSAALSFWYSLTLLRNGENLRNLSTGALFVCAVLFCTWAYQVQSAGEIKYVPPIMPGELEALEEERVAMLAGLSVLTNGVKKSVLPPQR